MSAILKKFKFENWIIIREFIYLTMLSTYLMLRVYNISWLKLGDVIPNFDLLTNIMEFTIYPKVLFGLFIVNFIFEVLHGEKIEYKKLLIYAIISIALYAVTFSSPDNARTIPIIALFICSDFTTLKKMFIASAIGVGLPTVVIVILAALGWTGELYVIDNRFGRVGYCLGFHHYSFWSRQLLFAEIVYLGARNKKITYVELAVLAILSYVVFYYSTHRLGFVTSLIAIIMVIAIIKLNIIKINNKIISILAVCVYPVAMLGSVLLSLFYDTSNNFIMAIDKVINGRIYLGKKAFELFEINLFGQTVFNPTPGTFFYLDNGYLYILFSVGVILTLLILAMHTYTVWRACKTNNTGLFIVMIATAAYFVIDNPVYELSCFGAILFTFPIMLKEHIKEKRLSE